MAAIEFAKVKQQSFVEVEQPNSKNECVSDPRGKPGFTEPRESSESDVRTIKLLV